MDRIPYLGEIAAIATAISWCTCSMLFAAAGLKIGSFAVNILRLVVGILLLSVTHLLLLGTPFPFDAPARAFFFLSLSGFVGLAIGDLFYFRALVVLGPRLGTLVMSMWPIFSTLMAWPMFGETMRPAQILGILVTLGGVAWVVMERRPGGPARESHEPTGRVFLGVVFGVCGAMGQALAYVLSKEGMGGDYNPLSATIIRMLTANVAMWVIVIAARKVVQVAQGASNRRALLQVAVGAVFGPFIGVWLSLVALNHTKTGIASTLIALVPVFIIPAVIIVYRKKPSPRAVLGAIVAVAGVAIIFLTKQP